MTRQDAIQRVGRLLWGLAFVERRATQLPAEDGIMVRQSCFLVDTVLGNDWRELVDPADATGHEALTKRLLRLERETAENLVRVIELARSVGFQGLRETSEYELALAVEDMHYWESIHDFFATPAKAIKSIGNAMGTAIGAVIGGVLQNPALIVALVFLIWYFAKGKK